MDVSCETLRALATGVALDASLQVKDGEPGSGWAIDPHQRCIFVDPIDRAELPPEQVWGLTCHEAAHAAVTRYPWLVPAGVLDEPGVALLLNALEDCRIEQWLVDRLPGTVPWIDAYNQRLFPEEGGRLAAQVPAVQYCLAIVHQWWHGSVPDGLHPSVRSALQETDLARREVVRQAPPTSADTPARGYEGSRVQAVFRQKDGTVVDAFEQNVRLSAARAWSIIWLRILPTFRTLAADTPPDELRALEQAHLQAHTARWEAGPPTGRVVPSEQAREAMRREALHPAPHDTWDEARREVLPLVDALCSALAALLRPRTRSRWSSGFTQGQRPDLRAAMQREARPDRLDVWCRKSLPDRPDPAFLLALDLSGSMRGSPIHWAFRGLVVLAEALERLQLPFEIWGFQDVPIPFKRLHEPLGVQRTILNALPLEVLGRRAGGHNRPEHNWDGPVLETLQHRLGQHRTPLLLVVSDGAPSGPTHPEARLRAAINNLSDHVRLVGIGLGPDAHHVADYYPRSVITALDTFPAAIAQCLEESLHGP